MTLRPKVEQYIRERMCIDTKHLLDAVNQPSVAPHRDKLLTAINSLYDAINSTNSENDIHAVYMHHADLHDHPKAHSVLDSMRHAFRSFACGGLHHLYTYKEDQEWYPKVEILRELTPNDIPCLDEITTIYRGCNISEFQTKTYGQAWTTCLDVAKAFAHINYCGQPWFIAAERVILSSSILRSSVLYSDQSGEFEVAVKVNDLGPVEIRT